MKIIKLKKSVEEEIVRNPLHVIDSSIYDKVKLKFDVDMSEDGGNCLN